MKKAASFLLRAFFCLMAVSSTAAKEDPYHWTNVGRIVAIGDVHGAYENLVAILKNASLIDKELKWIGGGTHLVQLGDVVDRGARSRECMDLLMELEKDAQKKGGRVHVLIGNHEAMNIVGILDYTTPEELAAYDDRRSRDYRKRAFELYVEEKKQEARQAERKPPPEDELRKLFDAEHPRGYFGHRAAFGPQGRYGKWILEHSVSIKINTTVFSHGDWSEEISALGIEEVNRRIRDELSGESPIEEGMTFHLKGPLQYRGLAEVLLTRQQQETHREIVDRTLANLGATRMVVGHTATDGVIEPRFGGKHISVDVGMNPLYEGGHEVALEIALQMDGDTLWAIHPGGRVRLPDYLDETTQFDYLVAVAAVDFNNVNVYRRLASEYEARGNLEGTRDAMERLFLIDKSYPFRHRRTLGDIYRKLGNEEKAREQDRLFMAGMQSLIEATPENPLLSNLLARFCLDRNLELDMAEEAIDRALRAEPENSSFLLTSGRMQYVRRRYRDAVDTLKEVVDAGGAGYEVYYYLGLSYLELDDLASARRFFEMATQKDPERREAREALSKMGKSENHPQRERKEL